MWSVNVGGASGRLVHLSQVTDRSTAACVWCWQHGGPTVCHGGQAACSLPRLPHAACSASTGLPVRPAAAMHKQCGARPHMACLVVISKPVLRTARPDLEDMEHIVF